jgi:hypothetical protein
MTFSENYYLESTCDKTDRTTEIEEKLTKYGACLLGTGVYYVSGVKMPDNTTIMGMGTATRVILADEIEDGAAIRLGSYCSVKDLFVRGSEGEIDLPDGVGTRHGLLFKGYATPKEHKLTGKLQPKHSMISGCEIAAFTGGGITCTDTGYSARSALTVVNCQIIGCGAGINISHFSEFHEFTNVLCITNNYGCINNGGNNVFVNCGFTGNKTGFMIDNSEGQSPNNSHGSMVGCTINHSGSNEGIGLHILGATSGYVFSGCQIFFSKVVIENSTAIQFDNTNFGKNAEISVKGGALTIFSSAIFTTLPRITVENNPLVKFVNCYTRAGTTVDVPKPAEE